MVTIGQVFPNFTAETTQGSLDFYRWVGDSWCIFFSYYSAYEGVCVSELTNLCQEYHELEERGIKLIGLSIDDLKALNLWINDIKHDAKLPAGKSLPFPIISDSNKKLSKNLNILHNPEGTENVAPCSAVFIIGPDKRLVSSMFYPPTVGRSFTEIVRTVDALMLTSKKKVATPANWAPGEPVMVHHSISGAKVKEHFQEEIRCHEMPSGKDYMISTTYKNN